MNTEENHLTNLVLGQLDDNSIPGSAQNHFNSSSDLLQLRQVAQDRIINEMIVTVK